MATNIQRWQAIGDALLNRTATTAQMTKLGLAIAKQGPDLEAYNAMTNGEKAGYAIAYLRRHLLHLVVEYDEALGVAQAKGAARMNVSTEFAES